MISLSTVTLSLVTRILIDIKCVFHCNLSRYFAQQVEASIILKSLGGHGRYTLHIWTTETLIRQDTIVRCACFMFKVIHFIHHTKFLPRFLLDWSLSQMRIFLNYIGYSIADISFEMYGTFIINDQWIMMLIDQHSTDHLRYFFQNDTAPFRTA